MPYRLCRLVCLLLMVHVVYGREFAVGGTKGWTVPSDPQAYNQWAEQSRFQIGDILLFIYEQNQDSVLQVTKEAYENCNTEEAVTAKFKDGHTSFMLNRSGPYYFISGNKEKCHKNEKLVIIVMADHKSKHITPSSSPSHTYTGTLEITPGNAALLCSSSAFFTSISVVFVAAMASSL